MGVVTTKVPSSPSFFRGQGPNSLGAPAPRPSWCPSSATNPATSSQPSDPDDSPASVDGDSPKKNGSKLSKEYAICWGDDLEMILRHTHLEFGNSDALTFSQVQLLNERTAGAKTQRDAEIFPNTGGNVKTVSLEKKPWESTAREPHPHLRRHLRSTPDVNHPDTSKKQMIENWNSQRELFHFSGADARHSKRNFSS